MNYTTLVVLITHGDAHSLFVDDAQLQSTIEDCRKTLPKSLLGFVSIERNGDTIHYDAAGVIQLRTPSPFRMAS